MSNKRRFQMTLVTAAVVAVAGLSGCNAQKVTDLERRVIELESKLKKGQFKSLQIVDDKGKEHAVFGLRSDGTPHLKIVDGEGNNRFLLRLHADGTPVLVMWGKGTKSSAYLSVPGEGPPQLMMFDKKGSQALKLP